ncbi:MAG: redox-sensitive transcriptional activator SoxR [Erythrobacter sp.]|nr:redox-sensitive transcriptional activator SoxR [Erythrobacter sp.]
MIRLKPSDLLSIGEIARRTGLSVSAIRFYEEQGLIEPVRSGGNQRRFLRSDIRRLSFILIAQKLGLALGEIKAQLATLPQGRTPNARDWEAISRAIRATLDSRIEELTRTRDRLDGCIGCGCLSLENCAIWNPQDQLAAQGPGPRKLIA